MSSCRTPSSSRLDPNRDPPSLTPTSAIYDLDARALESPSERLQNSFVDANHADLLVIIASHGVLTVTNPWLLNVLKYST